MPCFRICFPISNCILLFLVLSGAISHYLQTVCKLVYRIVIYIVYAIYVLYFKIFTLFFFRTVRYPVVFAGLRYCRELYTVW